MASGLNRTVRLGFPSGWAGLGVDGDRSRTAVRRGRRRPPGASRRREGTLECSGPATKGTRFTALAVGLIALALPAQAAAQAPPATKSSNVEHITTLPDPATISANFRGNLMYLSTLKGLTIYDISKPEAPTEVGRLPLPHFENEDVDTNGEILLISNDPSEGVGILYVIDVRDPANPSVLSTINTGTALDDFGLGILPEPLRTGTGHTASCIHNCQFVYLAGTSKGIDIVDLRDPANPKMAGNFPAPEATGLTSHDIQVDSEGLAWVTGYGGTAAYDVTDPLAPKLVYKTDETGASQYGDNPANDGKTLNDFIHHNSNRLNWGDLAASARPSGAALTGESDVVAVTEEDYTRPTCEGAGQFETWRIGPDKIMRNLDSFVIEVDPTRATLCSAHYFDVRDGLVAQGWYEGGTRFLDVTNPADIRQVGYWIPAKNVTWSVYYPPTDPTGEIVYSLDTTRGIDVIRIDRGKPADTSTPAPGGGTGGPLPDAGGTPGQTAPDVKLRIGDRRGLVRAGKKNLYTVSVRNGGRATASDIAVTVDLPAGTRWVRGGKSGKRGRQVTFTVDSLASKATRKLRFSLKISKRFRGTTLSVSGAATTNGDTNPRDNFAVDRNKVRKAKASRRRSSSKAPADGAERTAAMPTAIAPPVSDEDAQAWGYTFGMLCRIQA